MRVIGKMLDVLLGEGFMRGGREDFLAISGTLRCLGSRLGCGFGDWSLGGGL